jgi:hypothetical protein
VRFTREEETSYSGSLSILGLGLGVAVRVVRVASTGIGSSGGSVAFALPLVGLVGPSSRILPLRDQLLNRLAVRAVAREVFLLATHPAYATLCGMGLLGPAFSKLFAGVNAEHGCRGIGEGQVALSSE